jgi:hypothetical protein
VRSGGIDHEIDAAGFSEYLLGLTWLKFADLRRAPFPDLRFPREDGVNVRTKPTSRLSIMAPP